MLFFFFFKRKLNSLKNVLDTVFKFVFSWQLCNKVLPGKNHQICSNASHGAGFWLHVSNNDIYVIFPNQCIAIPSNVTFM